MTDKPKLARQAMCDRLAMEFQDGWIVNLGVGMPTLCSNYVDPAKEIIFHSENGVIGYGHWRMRGAKTRIWLTPGDKTSLPGLAWLLCITPIPSRSFAAVGLT